ncbi:hypothetical protein [Legionella nagasakiensis]|uniref:hypothetical protein n=1 Tax=Legionella nagasakiensis TaxID=535290 RepID=UPI001056B569|nr:hypothetical protein [Legionella nagasakiensis]
MAVSNRWDRVRSEGSSDGLSTHGLFSGEASSGVSTKEAAVKASQNVENLLGATTRAEAISPSESGKQAVATLSTCTRQIKAEIYGEPAQKVVAGEQQSVASTAKETEEHHEEHQSSLRI